MSSLVQNRQLNMNKIVFAPIKSGLARGILRYIYCIQYILNVKPLRSALYCICIYKY